MIDEDSSLADAFPDEVVEGLEERYGKPFNELTVEEIDGYMADKNMSLEEMIDDDGK